MRNCNNSIEKPPTEIPLAVFFVCYFMLYKYRRKSPTRSKFPENILRIINFAVIVEYVHARGGFIAHIARR